MVVALFIPECKIQVTLVKSLSAECQAGQQQEVVENHFKSFQNTIERHQ